MLDPDPYIEYGSRSRRRFEYGSTRIKNTVHRVRVGTLYLSSSFHKSFLVRAGRVVDDVVELPRLRNDGVADRQQHQEISEETRRTLTLQKKVVKPGWIDASPF